MELKKKKKRNNRAAISLKQVGEDNRVSLRRAATTEGGRRGDRVDGARQKILLRQAERREKRSEKKRKRKCKRLTKDDIRKQELISGEREEKIAKGRGGLPLLRCVSWCRLRSKGGDKL